MHFLNSSHHRYPSEKLVGFRHWDPVGLPLPPNDICKRKKFCIYNWLLINCQLNFKQNFKKIGQSMKSMVRSTRGSPQLKLLAGQHTTQEVRKVTSKHLKGQLAPLWVTQSVCDEKWPTFQALSRTDKIGTCERRKKISFSRRLDRPGYCKWSSKWTGLLKMIIRIDLPPANDHLDLPASYKWSSG